MPTRKRKLPQQHTGEHKKSNPNLERWTRARTYLNPTSAWPTAMPSTPPEKRRGQKTSARRRAKAPAPEMQEPPTPPAEKLICRRRGPQQAPLPAEEARPTHAGKLDLAPPPSSDGEPNLDLGNLHPSLYTSARRFRGPPPSPTPDRPPERRGAAKSPPEAFSASVSPFSPPLL